MTHDHPAGGPHPDPVELVDRYASGYRQAQILMTAVRLRLFEALEGSPAGADELADRLDADPRGVRILADALAALGILEKRPDGRWANGPPAREALLPDSPRSKVAMILHGARLYERWGGLYDSVKEGEPVPDERIDPRLESDERAFAAAMADVGRDSAATTADALERAGHLDGVDTILDLGGGPGLYAVELARRLPRARATVFDRPETAEVARETAAEAGLSDRVGARSGDLHEDDLGGPYDLVLASNLVHIYPPEENRRMVGRAAAVLAPGGRLAIKDFLLEPARTEPTGAALFAVNMLVSTGGGDCYAVDEVHGWFREHGLEPAGTLDLTAQSRLTVGRKP